jgi:hypothetical protein
MADGGMPEKMYFCRSLKQNFVVELKIWRGDMNEQMGRDQLSEYLATRGKDEGYLVTFDFSKKEPTLPSVATSPSVAAPQNNTEPE